MEREWGALELQLGTGVPSEPSMPDPRDRGMEQSCPAPGGEGVGRHSSSWGAASVGVSDWRSCTCVWGCCACIEGLHLCWGSAWRGLCLGWGSASVGVRVWGSLYWGAGSATSTLLQTELSSEGQGPWLPTPPGPGWPPTQAACLRAFVLRAGVLSAQVLTGLSLSAQEVLENLKDRWYQADNPPSDLLLTEDEFLSFLHPEHSRGMLKFMVKEIVRDLGEARPVTWPGGS